MIRLQNTSDKKFEFTMTEHPISNPEESPKAGTFEKHIQEVEYDFWNNRFKVYGKWRKNWYYEYKKRGYFINY